MSEFKTAEDSREVGKTTATATLPGMTIEISHHHPQEGDREEIFIKLQAMPSFEAFGSFFEAMNPFSFWANATQLTWSSWLRATQAMMLPSNVVSTTESRPLARRRPQA